MSFAGRPVEEDVSPGSWIADAVREDATIGSLLPPVFQAYARIFHPAVRYREDVDVDVRWADVAAANGTVAHAVMQWGSVTGAMEYFDGADQAPLWHGAPALGHLPEHVAARLAAVLGRHTDSPEDCWFGVPTEFIAADGPTLTIGGKEFWLVRGPVETAALNMAEEPVEQSAGVWWPADRAWCVATDRDLVTTYVGGSATCVAALLADPGLEAWEASVEQGVDWDADEINPLPLDS